MTPEDKNACAQMLILFSPMVIGLIIAYIFHLPAIGANVFPLGFIGLGLFHLRGKVYWKGHWHSKNECIRFFFLCLAGAIFIYIEFYKE